MAKEPGLLPGTLQEDGKSVKGAAGRFVGYQGRVWDGATDGYGRNGGVRYQRFAGLARVGAELPGNIISNYRTPQGCERSERIYNFDYVRGKQTGY